MIWLALLLACDVSSGDTADTTTDTDEVNPPTSDTDTTDTDTTDTDTTDTDTTDTDTTDTDTTDTDTPYQGYVGARLDIVEDPADIDSIEFAGASASCSDGELSLVAEILGGAESVWVDAVVNDVVVATYELALDTTDPIFQSASAVTTGDCDVDTWIWRAETGSLTTCLVSGDNRVLVAEWEGCTPM